LQKTAQGSKQKSRLLISPDPSLGASYSCVNLKRGEPEVKVGRDSSLNQPLCCETENFGFEFSFLGDFSSEIYWWPICCLDQLFCLGELSQFLWISINQIPQILKFDAIARQVLHGEA
jgi:hypothetical protein